MQDPSGNDLHTAQRRIYEDNAVVRFYAGRSALQPAEARIVASLGDRIRDLRLLDLGVGGGRTTASLGPSVKSYVGVDFSEAMIAACKRRFAGAAYSFVQADARELPFDDASFDAVLFSYNGIDCVDHEARLRVLAEVRRVLVSRGHFFFSTHNLHRDDLHFEATPKQPLTSRVLGVFRRRKLRRANPGYEELLRRDYALINDGAHGFRGALYHIRLRAEVAQLTDAGFDVETVYGGRDGRTLDLAELDRVGDPWCYFACRSPARERG